MPCVQGQTGEVMAPLRQLTNRFRARNPLSGLALAPERTLPALRRYGSVVLALLVATLLRVYLDPVVGESYSLLAYSAAVVFAAWYAGVWPALLTLGAGALLVNYLFASPRGTLELEGPADWVGFGLYVGTGLIIIGLMESLRVSRARTEASERRLRLAVRAAEFGTYDLDLATGEQIWSPELEALLGLTKDAPLEPGVAIMPGYVHPADQESVQRAFRASLDPGGSGEFSSECRIVRPDGSERWVLVKGQTFFAGRGRNRRAVRAAGVVLDVAELKRTEEALRQANAHKDQFLAILGHELRNPLSAISNALQVVERQPRAPFLSRADALIRRQVDHITRLVDDLQDLSRIGRGKLALHPERVDGVRCMRHALETVRPLIETHRHTLDVSLPDEPLWLEADPVRLQQIVVNLLTNAAKYTPEGGRIELSAAQENGEMVIRVRDNGMGIAPERLSRIFEPLQQAAASEHSRGGLGVGLALVKGLAEQHGGRVAAASAGPGKGAEFTVRLPAA